RVLQAALPLILLPRAKVVRRRLRGLRGRPGRREECRADEQKAAGHRTIIAAERRAAPGGLEPGGTCPPPPRRPSRRRPTPRRPGPGDVGAAGPTSPRRPRSACKDGSGRGPPPRCPLLPPATRRRG